MFVIAGEVLMDLVIGCPNKLSTHIGGGPFNTGLALARLGNDIGFLHPPIRVYIDQRPEAVNTCQVFGH